MALETLLGVLELVRRALGSIWRSFGNSVGNLEGAKGDLFFKSLASMFGFRVSCGTAPHPSGKHVL